MVLLNYVVNVLVGVFSTKRFHTRSLIMNFVGVDLHKKVISICIVSEEQEVVYRQRLACACEEKIREWFAQRVPFQVVVEATASYEWFVRLVEPMAERVVLAHPKKLRVIAESTRKSDKLDAQVLAEFLALDMIPEAHRPTPRVREHRSLVRHRVYVQRRITSVKTKIRRILSNYNVDRTNLFSRSGMEYLGEVKVSAADRFVLDQLIEEWQQHHRRLLAVGKQLGAFAKEAPVAEREARAVLETIPTVGPVTIDVVLSELGDVRRFRSQKRAVSYAGLAPGHRESAGRVKQLGISKEGSKLLRWILTEAAWRLVGKTRYWGQIYERLRNRCGPKKAIVAVARRLLCVMISMLQSGRRYRLAKA
jgi:transposase